MDDPDRAIEVLIRKASSQGEQGNRRLAGGQPGSLNQIFLLRDSDINIEYIYPYYVEKGNAFYRTEGGSSGKSGGRSDANGIYVINKEEIYAI